MNTIESWDNFTRYYGGIVGARDCFELVCEDLLKRENPTCEVHRIKASRGDGGIDIHVSNGKLVQIYQCKFFVDVLNTSRWQQIDNSFLKVLEQQEININEWFLCVPKEFTKEEIIEIENFKNKYSTKGIKITFIDGNELISRMKEVSICEKWFSPVPQRCLCINEPKICPEYIDRIEVETLKEYILSRKHHLLISGIGGMGKTTLAEKLFNEVKMMFDVALWMTYKGSVVAGIAMAMAEKSVDEDLIMHFEKRMNSKDNQRNVIFIDDVDDNYLSDKNRDILERNAIVIVTSRMESISGYITHEVLPLNDIDCIKLFKEYYKRTISSDDEEMIIELVNRFGKSTLLIELFARAANKSTKELNEYLGCILEKGISSTGIKVQNNKEKTYAKIAEHLATLYSLENMSDERKRILINFSLTKEKGVIRKFIQIIKASDEDIGDLVEFGWIKRNDEGFYMHSLIRECVRNQVEECDKYVADLKQYYTDRDLYQDEYSIIEKGMHFDIIVSLLKIIKFNNEKDVYILYNLIQLLDGLSFYDSLDSVVGLAIQELEKFEESQLRAKIGCDIFNAAGLAYLSSDKNKALISFLCVKQLLDKFLPKEEKALMAHYCNMGLAYSEIDFEKANQFLQEALEREKQYYGEYSMEVADVYHNIGKNYLSISDYENASFYLEKALQIKRTKSECTYSLIKTEFGLANALNFMLKEPFLKEDVEKIRELYVSVLEGYNCLRNINIQEYYNTLWIISEFLDKIGEKKGAVELKQLIECDKVCTKCKGITCKQ